MNACSDTVRWFAVWLAAVGVIVAADLAGQGWLEWVGVVLLTSLVAVGIWQRRIDLEAIASLPLFSSYAAPFGLLIVGSVASVLLLEASLDLLSILLIIAVTATSVTWIVISTRRLYRLWNERSGTSPRNGGSTA